MAHALQQPHMHESHRHLLAAGQALANMLSGAKSLRCINSWPLLLVWPLDSGRSLAFKVYLTSRLVWLATFCASPQRRFLARPRRQGYFPFPPCLAFLTYRSRRRPARH